MKTINDKAQGTHLFSSVLQGGLWKGVGMGMPDSGLRDGFGKPWSSGWGSWGLEMEGMGRVVQTLGRMQVLFVVNCAALPQSAKRLLKANKDDY